MYGSAGFQSLNVVAQVQGKTAADHYLVFPAHYCSCKAFLFDIVGRGEAAHVRAGPPTMRAAYRACVAAQSLVWPAVGACQPV